MKSFFFNSIRGSHKCCRFSVFFLFACYILFGQAAQAQTITWTAGSGTTQWDNSENWDPQTIPGEGASVVVPGIPAGIYPQVDTDTEIGDLDFPAYNNGAVTITENGTLTVTGALNINTGKLYLKDGGAVVHTGSSWNIDYLNSYTVKIDGGGSLTTSAGNPLIRSHIHIPDGSIAFLNGLAIDGGRNVGGENAHVTVNGTMTMESWSSLTSSSLIYHNSSGGNSGTATVKSNASIATSQISFYTERDLILGSSASLSAEEGSIETGRDFVLESLSELILEKTDIKAGRDFTAGHNTKTSISDGSLEAANNIAVTNASSTFDLIRSDLTAGNNVTTESSTKTHITDSEITIGNNLSASGEFTLTDATLSVANNFNQSGSFTSEGALINVNGEVSVNGSIYFGAGNSIFSESSDVIVRSGGKIFLTSSDAEVDFFGHAVIKNNGTLDAGDGRVTFHMDIEMQGYALIDVGDGDLYFLGDARFGNSSYLTIYGSGSVRIEGDGTFEQNGVLNAGYGSIYIGGDVTLQNSGTINGENGIITIAGDVELAQSGGTFNAENSTIFFKGEYFINSGSFVPGTSTFVFAGSGEQLIAGSNTDIEFFNLVINDDAEVYADQDVIVWNDMKVEDNADYENINNTTLNVVGEVIGEPAIFTERPYLVEIEVLDAITVRVRFDENNPLDPASAQAIANYEVFDNIQIIPPKTAGISNAVLSAGNIVILTLDFTPSGLDGLEEGIDYYLVVNNVQNTEGRAVNQNHRKRFGRPGAGPLVPPPGEGTPENPFLIETLDELYWIQQNPQHWDKHYLQVADIDAGDTQDWNNGAGWQPIGDFENRFTGHFDGQDHTLSNLHIDREEQDFIGLFGVIDEGAAVRNLGLAGVDIKGSEWTGALAGANFGEISNVYSTGEVSGSKSTGGLVGGSSGIISSSYSSANVTGEEIAGGLVGGVIGYLEEDGVVMVDGDGLILDSYATGNVSGSFEVGGLAGFSHGGQVRNSYARGSVSGGDAAGGLIGAIYSDPNAAPDKTARVLYSYATGPVTGSQHTGGLIGVNVNSEVENSFWNTETSGLGESDGGTGKTTSEMTSATTYTDTATEGLDEPWDFSDIWGISGSDNDGYPFLIWQGFFISGHMTASHSTITADGNATSMIVVQATDSQGNNLVTGGAHVELQTTAGTLLAVFDHQDGTYTAMLVASTSAQTALITGTINGSNLANEAEVVFAPGDFTTANYSYYPGGLDNGNLQLWLDAADPGTVFSDVDGTTPSVNGSKVARWTDKSPHARDALQWNSGEQPVYVMAAAFGGIPALEFGEQAFLPLNTSFIAHTDYTISLAVGRSSGKRFNPFLGGTDSETNNNLHLFWRENTTLNHHQYHNDYHGEVPAWNDSPEGEIQVFDLNSSLSSDARSIRRNGALVARGGSAGQLNSWYGSAIGRYIDASRPRDFNERFLGVFGELVMHDRSLDNTERIILENYLAVKWDRSLDAATAMITAPGGFTHQLAGIGRKDSDDSVGGTAYTSGGLGFSSGAGSDDFLSSNGGAGNFLMAVHNGLEEMASELVFTGGNIYERWNRVWYVEKTIDGAHEGNLELYFDFDDYFGAASPEPADEYVLLYHGSEDYFFTPGSSEVVSGNGTVENGRVLFEVSSGDIENGYYTLGIFDVQAVADPSLTTLSASPVIIEADGQSTSTITVQAKYPNGVNRFSGGDVVTLATNAGTIGTVTDNDDGTYTATLIAANTEAVATVTGTINGETINDQALVEFAFNIADAGETLITADPENILADGQSTSTITVQARDIYGVNLETGGDLITLSTTKGTLGGQGVVNNGDGTVTPHDNGDGTYTAVLTSTTNFETATITGTVNGADIIDQATVSFVPGLGDPATTTITAASEILTADGVSHTTIVVQVKDSNNNNLNTGGDAVTLSTSAGTLGGNGVVDNGDGTVTPRDNDDGTYTATITSEATPGQATISGTLNGEPVTDTAVVTFVDYVVRNYYPGGLENSDLRLWFDAADASTLFRNTNGTDPAGNNHRVAYWEDLSPGSHHATQEQNNRRPHVDHSSAFGGRPSVRFDGGEALVFDGSFIAGTDYTVSTAVARSSAKNFNVYLGGGSTGANNNLHLFWSQTARLNHHHWGNDYYANVPAWDETRDGELHRFTLSSTGRQIWRNGKLKRENSVPDRLNSWDGAAIGYQGHAGHYFEGHVGEITVYTRKLSVTEQRILENYKAARWGRALVNSLYAAQGGFVHQLVGVGRESSSDFVTQTAFTGGGLGFSAPLSGFLAADGHYLLAAHNWETGLAPDVVSLGSLTYERWNRTWHVQKVNSGSPPADGEVTIYFDFDDYGLEVPSSSETWALLYSSSDPEFGSGTQVVSASASVNGSQVRFTTHSSHLSNGYYTIGRNMGALTFYSRRSGDWNDPESWSVTGHGGGVAPFAPDQQSRIIIGGSGGTSHAITLADGSETVDAPGSVTVLNTGQGAGTLELPFEAQGKPVVLGGTGSFELEPGGTLVIGNRDGISSSASSGAIQTAMRSFSEQAHYIYRSAGEQITGTGLPVAVASLTIDNSSQTSHGVLLTGNVRVNGVLALNQGHFTIPSDRSLVASNQVYDQGALRALRQIQMPGGGTAAGWKLLSSPIDTDYRNLFSGMVTQGYEGSSLGLEHSGESLMPNVLWYDETGPGTDNQRWRVPDNADEMLVPGRGLFAFVFGDISGDDRYNQEEVMLEVIGRENQGNAHGEVNFNVTWTEEGDEGWNLLGNPFMATINWDNELGWQRRNIDRTVYVWSSSANNGQGAFLEWNGQTGSLQNGFIKPFQGFWVKANDGVSEQGINNGPGSQSPELIVHPEAKTISSSGTFYRHRPDHTEIEIIARSGDLDSRFFASFSNEGRTGWDPLDAWRLRSLSDHFIELYSITPEGERLAINNLPRRFSRTIEIPLDLDGMRDGFGFDDEVTLSFGRTYLVPEDWHVELADRETGKTTNLYAGHECITFHLRTKTTRYKSVFHKNATANPDREAASFTTNGVSGRSGEIDEEIGTHITAIIEESAPTHRRIYLPPDPRGLGEIRAVAQSKSCNGRPVLMKASASDARFMLRITPQNPDPEIPSEFGLSQNYPNPFNPGTIIPFRLAEEGQVVLEVYDISGRRLAVLVNEQKPAGYHEVSWNAGSLASGVYLYRLTTSEGVFVRKMTLVK